jgi:hypothetical protein
LCVHCPVQAGSPGVLHVVGLAPGVAVPRPLQGVQFGAILIELTSQVHVSPSLLHCWAWLLGVGDVSGWLISNGLRFLRLVL